VKELIEAAGASLRYLPPCPSHFNPIENVFAKLKALLHKAAERPSTPSDGKVIDRIRLIPSIDADGDPTELRYVRLPGAAARGPDHRNPAPAQWPAGAPSHTTFLSYEPKSSFIEERKTTIP
jgi:hypothetical protein